MTFLAGGKISQRSSYKAFGLNAAVLVKTVVLGGDNRLLNPIGNFVNRDEVSSFFAEFGNEFAVSRPHTHRNFRFVVNDGVNRRQLRINQRKYKQR